MDEYRCIRDAVLRLEMHRCNPDLRQLDDADIFRPSVTVAHEFGTGSRIIGWVWVVSMGALFLSGSPNSEFEQEGPTFPPFY